MAERTVDIECEIIKLTAEAVLINDGKWEVWLPLKHVEADELGLVEEHKCVITIPEWLAQDRGLI